MTKPLVIFDVETTGVDKKTDRIIQFAAIKIIDDEIVDSLNYYIQPDGNYSITIPAFFEHKITPKFLADKPYMFEVVDKIIEFIDGCDVLTYNGNKFDIPFLKRELNRCGRDIDFTQLKCYDAFIEEQKRHATKLNDTFRRYAGKSMEDVGLSPHDAFSDVKATYEIFKGQQKDEPYEPDHMYGEDGIIGDMNFLGEMKPCFTVGKYRKLSVAYVAQIDMPYLRWCVSDKSNFLPSTKKYIQQYIK